MNDIKQILKKFKFNELSKFFIMDHIFFLIFFLFMWVFSPDLVIITIFLLIVPYLMITRRKSLIYQFFVAFLLSLIWIFIANGKYSYSNDYVIVFGFNIFPMFAWTVGLFGLYLVYSHYERILNRRSFLQKFLLFTISFWVLLIAAESIAFHIFDIRNITKAAYDGLPFCNCLHAPFWMQVAYFLMGPLFFSICSLLRLRNSYTTLNVEPHILRSSKQE